MPSFRICSCLQSQEKKDVDPEESSATTGKEKSKKKVSSSSNHVAPEEPVNIASLSFRQYLVSLIICDLCSIINQVITFKTYCVPLLSAVRIGKWIISPWLIFCGIKDLWWLLFLPPRNSSCRKVMFSQACVIPSVHRGRGCILTCNWGRGCVQGVSAQGWCLPGKGGLPRGVYHTHTQQTPPRPATEAGSTHPAGITFLFCGWSRNHEAKVQCWRTTCSP